MAKENGNGVISVATNTKNTGRELVEIALKTKKDEFLAYEEMPEILKQLDLVKEDTDISKLVNNLRNGMSELNNEKDSLDFIIEEKVFGKKKSFRFVDKPLSARKAEVIEVIERSEFSSLRTVARRLMRERRMPLYGIYLPLRATARWVRYSEKSEESSAKKRKYEGDQCEKLLKDWFVNCKKQDNVLSIIGLGIGEGVGEIELIERLLKKGFKIHYLAIDMDPFLLLDHSTRLKYKFEQDIKNGKLICSVVAENFLENFGKAVEKARVKLSEKKITNDFIPKTSNILVSILGNVVGNLEERASEGVYFKVVQDKFEGQNTAFLIGVGVHQQNQADEHYELDDLFTTTPRYLINELGIIKSSLKPGEEFSLHEDNEKNVEEKGEKRFDVNVKDYQGDGLLFEDHSHVKGKIYEFFYTTKGELKMDIEGGQPIVLRENSKLLLYNIVKFDIGNLFGFLIYKGFHIPKYEEVQMSSEDMINVGTTEEKRLYAVFAVTT